MIDHTLIRRYMAAAFGLAADNGEIDAVREQFVGLQRAFTADGRLLAVLKHPEISDEEKQALVMRLLGDGASEVVRGLVSVALEKDRVEIFLGAGDVFTELADEAAGVVRAHVEVAHEPASDQSDRLEKALSRLMGKPVVLEFHNTPEVIGGARVRIDGLLIDGSLAGHVDRLAGDIAAGQTAVATADPES